MLIAFKWLLCVCWFICQIVKSQSTGSLIQRITINSNANAIIGAVVQVQERGSGLFGCGAPTWDGVARVEAMHWMVDTLNQEWNNSTFLPNVTIGVKVLDTCGRSRVAATHLVELLPMLKGDPVDVDANLTTPSTLQLGLVDGAELLGDSEVRDSLENYQVPVVSLDANTVLMTPETRAKALVSIVRNLKWQKCVVIHDNSYYSSQMLHTLTHYHPSDGSQLIADARSYESTQHSEYLEDNIQALELMEASIRNGLPVVILMSPHGAQPLLESFQKHWSSNVIRSDNTEEHQDATTEVLHHDIQLLFSNLVTHRELELIPEYVQVFSLAVWPSRITPFERYWQDRIHEMKNSSRAPSIEDKWLFDYVHSRPHCSYQNNSDSSCIDDDLNVALRSQIVIPAGQAILALAQALKQAWNMKCTNDTCRTQETSVGQENEEPLLYPHSDRGWLTELDSTFNLQLLRYSRNLSTGVVLKKVITVNQLDILGIEDHLSGYDDNSYLAPELTSEAANLPPIEHLRSESGRHIGSSQPLMQTIQPSQSLAMQENYKILYPSKDNLYIAVLMAVRKETHEGSLHCVTNDDDLDFVSIRQLEAFLWALKKINSKLSVQLGAVLLDSCNSRHRSMMLTAGLETQPLVTVAAVTSLPSSDAAVAEEILAATRVSSVSTGYALARAVANSTVSPYILQVETSLASLVSSVMGLLKNLGWTYVSVLYSDEGEYLSGFKQFQAAAAHADVCLALQQKITTSGHLDVNDVMSELVPRLVGARADGARGVLLLTTPQHTQQLMRALGYALAQGMLDKQDLFYLFVSPNGDIQPILHKFSNVVGGALIFRPYHRPARDFQQHLQHMYSTSKDSSSYNNPWLKIYFKQCAETDCLALLDSVSPTDSNTVQAVYAIATAVEQTWSNLYLNSTKLREVGELRFGHYNRFQLQQQVNKNLWQAVAEKTDGVGEETFTFTSEGAGNGNIEILNFRRQFNEWNLSSKKKNVFFEKVPSSLRGMVAYRESGAEMSLADLTSQCRASGCCSSPLREERVVLAPPTRVRAAATTFHVAAIFGVHEPSVNPLECGLDISLAGMEQLEAFLWAIDQVNKNNSYFGMAAVALDTCGSMVKASRGVTDLVTGSVSESVMGLISGGKSELSTSLLSALDHLRVPVLYAQASTSYTKHSPYPLELAASLRMRARGLLALLQTLQTPCVTIFYSQDTGDYEQMFKTVLHLLKQEENGIKLTGVPVPESSSNTSDVIRTTLEQIPPDGTAVIALLLPDQQVELVFKLVRSLKSQGQMKNTHLKWVALDSRETLRANSDVSLGAMLLQSKADPVSEFEEHFRSLRPDVNVRNPWFSEFWSGVFHCRGAACHTDRFPDLHSYNLKHNIAVVNTINSVMAIAHALETVWRDLCPGGQEVCNAMSDMGRVRRRLFEVVPRMAFVGVGLNAVAFNAVGENPHGSIEIVNLHRAGFVSVGFVDTSGKAHINSSLVLPNTEFQSRGIEPFCLDHQISEAVDSYGMTLKRRLLLLGVMPLSAPGSTAHCSHSWPRASLQLAALQYALNSVNHNSTVLPGVEFGLLEWDTCSGLESAHNAISEQLLSADKTSMLQTNDIIAAVTLDERSANVVAPLLRGHNITRLIIPLEMPVMPILTSATADNEFKTTDDNQIEAIVSLVHSLNTRSFSIVHGDTRKAELMAQRLQSHSLLDTSCLVGVYPLHNNNNNNNNNTDTLSARARTLKPGTLVILLIDEPDQIQRFLDACRVVNNLVFITTMRSADATHFNAGNNLILTLHPLFETENFISDLADQFVRSLNSEQAGLLSEMKSGNTTAQIRNIFGSVWTVAKGLHTFLYHHCVRQGRTSSFHNCHVLDSMKHNALLEENIMKLSQPTAYSLRNDDSYLGTWRHLGGLKMIAQLPRFAFTCYSELCTSCMSPSTKHPALRSTLQHPWAAALIGLALLGAFLTILIAVYFLAASALPNNMAVTTSALGYLILLGLLALFTATISFVVVPTKTLCGVRRLLPELSLAIICAGMLLKVAVMWRQGESRETKRDAFSRPAGLLVMSVALALVQVLLSGGWLVFTPPEVHTVIRPHEVPLLLCYPGGSFEMHLLISKIYIILLLTVTATLALVCYFSSNHTLSEQSLGEARWILTSCLLVAGVLTCWGILTVSLISPSRADLASALAHLTSAYMLLLCLYVPKLCMYSRQKNTKQDRPTQPPIFPVFEISHFQAATIKSLPAFVSPSLVPDDLEVYDDDDGDDNDDDLLEDPTQTVPSSLYSLAMFSSSDDGDDEDGSHCQPGTNEFTAPMHFPNPLHPLDITLQDEMLFV